MKREITYQWRVRELMARNHYRSSKELVEPLRERGITLSPVQIWRIVDQNPERISFQVLVALADIFNADVSELVTYTTRNAQTVRRIAAGELTDLRSYRPVRARIIDDDE
ncbi:helix-turn-helix domain-containing protein [Leifsonia aquatica]|uniref:helix-turn-helix domain-containing protein n=1 Tax=Leifsonia aquatica TaxID=144185 RepID=UPI00380C2E2F